MGQRSNSIQIIKSEFFIRRVFYKKKLKKGIFLSKDFFSFSLSQTESLDGFGSCDSIVTTQKENWNVLLIKVRFGAEKRYSYDETLIVQVGHQSLNVGDGGGAIQLKVSEKQIQFSGTLERSLGQQKIRNFWKHIKFSFLRENCLFLSSRSLSNNISWCGTEYLFPGCCQSATGTDDSNVRLLINMAPFLAGSMSPFLATVHYVGK